MLPDGYEISTDPHRLSLDVIHAFIVTSYWGAARTIEQTSRAVEHSLCFGLYYEGIQVGFARVVTDRAVVGYLCDVFVLPEHRNRGLGKALINAAVSHEDVRDLPVFLLNTRDAHDLYKQFGFGPLAQPENMLRRNL